MEGVEHELEDHAAAVLIQGGWAKLADNQAVYAHQDEIPAEGEEDLPVIDIRFQQDAITNVGANGCQMEDVIDVLVERLQGFQRGPFSCRENALAITKLEEARLWLSARNWKRQAQGVEGTMNPHTD